MLELESEFELESSWVYRYRPFSPLTLKELMYDEIYLSISKELNDPLDLQAQLYISKGKDYVYKFFMQGAFRHTEQEQENQEKYCNEVAQELSKESYFLNYIINELRDKNSSLVRGMKERYNKYNLRQGCFEIFLRLLIRILSNIYSPDKLYSSSFSKIPDNPSMWSLYANAHNGFCLIFSPTDNFLKLKNKQKDAPFEKFELGVMNYNNDISVDVATMFDEKTGEYSSRLCFEKYLPLFKEKSLLTKNECWKEEKEIRITSSTSIVFSAEKRDEKINSSLERIHHYEPSQLVGVILGIGLSEKDKKDIQTVVGNKNNQKIKVFHAAQYGNSIIIEPHSIRLNH